MQKAPAGPGLQFVRAQCPGPIVIDCVTGGAGSCDGSVTRCLPCADTSKNLGARLKRKSPGVCRGFISFGRNAPAPL